MAKSYVLRLRNDDGSWTFDMDTKMTKREAIKTQSFNRIVGGIQSTIWEYEEAAEIVKRVTQSA